MNQTHHQPTLKTMNQPTKETMKTMLCIAVAVMTQFVGLRAQSPFVDTMPASAATGSPDTPHDWSVVARGPQDRVWMKVTWQTNQLGQAVAQTNSYVEVGTGLHYLQAGQWMASQDLIELQPDGSAAALQGPHKVYFAPNLNSAGAITLVTASNRVFKTHLLGLAYYDAASGNAVLLSGLQDSTGEFLPPNQVVYKSAFANLNADVRYTYTKAGFESDVILLQQPPPPDAYGLNPQTTRLEVWHDFECPAEPRLTPRSLASDAADFVDQIADFGDLWFPTGAAYATDGTQARDPNTAAQIRVPNLAREPGLAPVAKTWLQTPNRRVLAESVRWAELQPALGTLPVATPALLPAVAQDRLACLAQVAAPRTRGGGASAIQRSGASYQPAGCVFDYTTVSGGGDYHFVITGNGATYYISANAYFSGTLTFEAGVFIKFEPNTWLLTYGSIVCHGSSGNDYTYLTSKDDDLFGDQIAGSTHSPTYAAYAAIWAYYMNAPVSISGMRIRWATIGAEIDGGSGGSVSDCQFEFCQCGILSQSCVPIYVSGTMCGVGIQFSPPGCISGSLTDICAGDSDSNGLPDLWEYKYFGKTGTDLNADPDGDCLSNLQEYQQGSNPRDWPVITSQPASQLVLQGANVTFSAPTVQACLSHQWHGYPYRGNYAAIPGAVGPSLTLTGVSFADDASSFYDAITNGFTRVQSASAMLSVFDTLGWNILTYFNSHSSGKTIDWITRSYPPNWPSSPPSLTWGTDSLLCQWNGYTAISPCNSWELQGGGGGHGQMTVTALTPRHGYMRGHGTAGVDGPWSFLNGQTVWFCAANNDLVPATVAGAFVRCGSDCTNNPYDYTILVFTADLPGTIIPMPVMPLPDSTYQNPNHVWFTTCQDGKMSANVAPFNTEYLRVGGDSGAPDMLPMPDGTLVFFKGRTTSGPSTQMQADMDYLCTNNVPNLHLNPNNYQLVWNPQRPAY